jgi:hypothetical protein
VVRAGLRNGPGLQEAIKEAGLVPEKIGQLDPPPDRGARPGGQPGGDQRSGDRREGERTGGLDRPGERPRQGGGGYSIEQAVSDRAQLNTIAFDGLAFLTGGFACNTFLPPGKVADFILGGAGHLRVTVSQARAKVEYVRAFLPRDENKDQRNGQGGHTYEVTAPGGTGVAP